MGTDIDEVVETLPYPCSFKVHHIMCTELMRLVDRIVNIFPEIEAARPRCSSGIQALCSLNKAIEKAKSLLQYCSESSKLYLAITGTVILSRLQNTRNLLEKSLAQIHNMVPVMLAVEISQIIDDLAAAVFVLDPLEEEAGKVVRELLQLGAAASDSVEDAEVNALKLAASRLYITSPKAIVIEKRSIKKLLDKIGDSDPKRKNILEYLLRLLRKYGNLVVEEQTENAHVQRDRSFGLKKPSYNSVHVQAMEVGASMKYEKHNAQTEMLSGAKLPEEFKCPISSKLMYDPVVIASGQTFERIWIQKWFDEGNDTCPKTKMKLAHLSLTPNSVMKDLISKWCNKYGITIPNPRLQLNALHSLETSSISIASFGSSMNDLHLPRDVSNISVGSLDTSYSSDTSHAKIAGGLSLTAEQMHYDIHRHQFSMDEKDTELESLSRLDDLHWESQCKVVEDMNNHLKYNAQACHSMSFDNFVEPLIKFLSNARESCDIRAQRAGSQLLSTFASKNRREMQYLDEDAFSLLWSILDSGVTKEALDAMEVLSDHPNCRCKITASGALASIVKILDSSISEFQERAIKILHNLSFSNDVCSSLASLVPKLVPFLHDDSLARYCIVVLKNLCNNQGARVSIAETTGCIGSVAELLEYSSFEVQEHAVAVLLSLCSERVEYCNLVMDEGVIPAVCNISVNGNDKGRAYALELLRLLRDVSYDNEQECFASDLSMSEDASNNSKEKKSSHRTSRLFGMKIAIFSKSSSLRKKK